MREALPNQEKIKVAFVYNQAFFLGGGEISFSELIRALNKSLFEPVILVPSSGEIEAFFERQKVKVLVTPFPPLIQMLPRPFASFGRLLASLKNTKPNLIHANGSRVCFYSVLAGRLLGIPVIWHVRETLKDLFFYDAFLGLASKNIVCVSKSVGTKRFRRFGSLLERKITVVYNGVDTSRLVRDEQARDQMRKRLSIHSDEVLFGMLGNIIPRKGYEFFLQGLAESKKLNHQLSTKALIVGRRLDSEYYVMLMRLISDLHLQGSVLFEDYSENVQALLSAMDVFVLSSRSEGFSRALLEAMSSGLPVLATRISEIEEAVADQENALLINFGDIESMASAILTLSKDGALRKSMGEKNRERAVEKFDLKAHSFAVENLYRKLTSRKP
jgi:glycosyltransferase involved in cell wall biosynthesis